MQKRTWDDWWADVASGLDEAAASPVLKDHRDLDLAASLPTLSVMAGSARLSPCLPEDNWDNGSLGLVPDGRSGHTAVWTGSIMVVWGGYSGQYLNSGGRYDPATDTWTPMSTADAPSARLPKHVIEEAGLTDEVELRVREGAVVILPAAGSRAGWADVARLMRERGVVFLVDLDPTQGGEIRKMRPCVIVSPDELNREVSTMIVAPLTSGSHSYPFRPACRFRRKMGFVVLDQVRAVDRGRLVRRLGRLTPPVPAKTLALLQEMFAP